jgi:hypothetical protein
MSDNVSVSDFSSGTAVAIATDDINGTHYPMFKVVHGTVNNAKQVTESTPLPVQIHGSNTGGLSVYSNLDVGTTGAVVKAAGGLVFTLQAWNLHGSATRYLKLYDKSTGASSADTPKATYPIKAGDKIELAIPQGIGLSNGIGLRASTGIAANDNVAPGANEVVTVLTYK